MIKKNIAPLKYFLEINDKINNDYRKLLSILLSEEIT